MCPLALELIDRVESVVIGDAASAPVAFDGGLRVTYLRSLKAVETTGYRLFPRHGSPTLLWRRSEAKPPDLLGKSRLPLLRMASARACWRLGVR